MNVEQFLKFMDEIAVGILSPPVHPFKNEWKKIYESIKPHFYGQVPLALDTAFPNEDDQILQYRKRTYQPKTESPLVKAITELNRLLSSAKHSIRFDNLEMQQYIEEKTFGDVDLTKYFFNLFVPYRVLDPNAVLLVSPVGDGIIDETQRVDIELKPIQSDRIVFNDPDYKLLIYKGINKKKYSSFALEQPLWYHIVTDEFYAEVKSIDGQSEFTVLYNHNMGIVPWITMGGRAVPMYDNYGNAFVIYKSDFSPAIPYLNDAAIYDNQHKSVMLSTCFPIKFVEGVDCNTCHGTGRLIDPVNHDNSITCNSCHGHGKTLSISPLAAYNINPTTNKFGNDKEQVDPIRYFSPDVSTIQETRTVASDALMKAEQVLNINRSLNAAQSGVAKEMDREPEYIEVGKISDDVYGKLHDILYIIQGLVFLDLESNIIVNPPISFDLKTETDLMQEFAESQKGQPAAIRYEAYRSYMDRRFASDPIARRIADICAMYTSIYLYTVEERNIMIASNQITQEDAIKATFVFDATTTLYYENNFDIMTNDFTAINNEIDKILQPRFEAVKITMVPEQIDFNQQFNVDDMDDDNM